MKTDHPDDKRVGRSAGDAYSTALVKGRVVAPSCSSPSLTMVRFGLNHLSSRIMPSLIACSPEKSEPLREAWQRSPPGEGPNLHALLSAVPAAADLSIPTGAEFIKAVMRGFLTAVSAEAVEPLGSI